MAIQIILEKQMEGGYTIYVPSLPGCISQGETKMKALKNIKEAIQLHEVQKIRFIDKKKFDILREIVNKHDPIHIFSGRNINEYDYEIEDIYHLCKRCKSIDECENHIHKTFVKWFGRDIAGDKGRYHKLAKELFNVLKRL